MSYQNEKILKQTEDFKRNYSELFSLGQGQPLPTDDWKPVHQIFAEIALANPNNIAILESNGKKITYADLHNWSLQIADKIAADNIGVGKRIAILVEPSMAMIAAVLGVLYSGAAYVPLDHALPNERIEKILSSADVSGIFFDDASFERVHKLGFPLYKVSNDKNLINLNYRLNTILVNPVDCAYLIYTSGSTGEPKGVVVEHRQLSNSTLARRMVYPDVPVFLLVSPLAFDSSIAGIWGTLTTGGKLITATRDEIKDPERLLIIIQQFEVSHLLSVPSLYDALLYVIENREQMFIPSLKTVIVAGESLSDVLVKRHFALFQDTITLVNEYGPTETTVWATYHRFEKPEPVSIGIPIPGTHVYILDEHQQLVQKGEIGELYIGGSQVARGYFGCEELTNQAFLKDIFNTNQETRMYRTGDLTRWNENGTLDFIGRLDRQVKIRGQRIELDAVETALKAIPQIRDAIVVPNDSHTLLIAFIITNSDLTTEVIRQLLVNKLPAIMIPTFIYKVDNFPFTISGKVDRLALSVSIEEHNNSDLLPKGKDQLSEKPTNIIDQVVSAWKEVLKTDEIPLKVNFFDLGGHSLLIFKLVDALEHHTGKRLPVVSLFRHTTVFTQAELIYDNVSIENRSEQNLDVRRARFLRTQRRISQKETI